MSTETKRTHVHDPQHSDDPNHKSWVPKQVYAAHTQNHETKQFKCTKSIKSKSHIDEPLNDT